MGYYVQGRFRRHLSFITICSLLAGVAAVVPRLGAQSAQLTYAKEVNFQSVPVGSVSPAVPVTFTFDSAGTIQAPAVLTQGAPNLDFKDAATGTCTTNGTSHSYKAGNSCTVNVTFSPRSPGPRYGAVVLNDSSGTPILTAYVYGIGVGPQMAFSPAMISEWPWLASVWGLVVDSRGNIYTADWWNGVLVFPAGCTSMSCSKVLGGGFEHASDLALDGSGNIYVADSVNDAVKEMPPGCVSSACVTTLGGGFFRPYIVAVDGSGNVYVADGNDGVKKMPPGCTSSACVSLIYSPAGHYDYIEGVAVDGMGTVYLTDGGGVKAVPPGCTSFACAATLGGGFYEPTRLALDAYGNIYVVDYGNGAVKKVPPGCTSSACVVTLIQAPFYANEVAVDGSGNLFATSGSLLEYHRATPPAVRFANTPVGSESIDSPKTVTVENIGNAPLTFPIPSSGENPSVGADFALDSSGASDCPALNSRTSQAGTLAAGASCNLRISFDPVTIGGLLSESLVLTDNNANAAGPGYATQSISLGGWGTTLLKGWLDVAIDARTRSTTVAQSDSLMVAGWAMQDNGTPAKKVVIQIDGNTVGNATLGMTRADVHGAFKNSAYRSSGWGLSYPASALSLGTHTVTAMAYDSLDQAVMYGPLTFTVATTSVGPPSGWVDFAGDARTGWTTVSRGGAVLVKGWATDPQDAAPVSKVTILIDGTAVGNATLGLYRPDISTAFNNTAFLRSGWTFTYDPVLSLLPGMHTVSAVAYDSLNMSTTLTTTPIRVQ
jgi:hypothetical protein